MTFNEKRKDFAVHLYVVVDDDENDDNDDNADNCNNNERIHNR
jgi:hypothetical protein